MDINLQIKLPAVIESVIFYFVLKYRKKIYGYPFRKIKLTKGQYAIVDPENFYALNLFRWYAKYNGYTYYAERKEKTIRGRETVRMHRLIMDAPENKVIDHRNRNGLDNRKANLRAVSQQENNWNSKRGMNTGSSKYKGVNYDKAHKKYRASIWHNGKKIHLGYFDTEIEAAKAYDKAAKKYRGQFAVLNLQYTDYSSISKANHAGEYMRLPSQD